MKVVAIVSFLIVTSSVAAAAVPGWFRQSGIVLHMIPRGGDMMPGKCILLPLLKYAETEPLINSSTFVFEDFMDFMTLADDTMGPAVYGYANPYTTSGKKDAIQEVKSSRKGVKGVAEEEDDEDEHSFLHAMLHKGDKHIILKTKVDDSNGKRVKSARFRKLFPLHVDGEKKISCGGEGHHYDSLDDCDGLE